MTSDFLKSIRVSKDPGLKGLVDELAEGVPRREEIQEPFVREQQIAPKKYYPKR